jgi:hypothetical protein
MPDKPDEELPPLDGLDALDEERAGHPDNPFAPARCPFPDPLTPFRVPTNRAFPTVPLRGRRPGACGHRGGFSVSTVSRKKYVNRQSGYEDHYTIAYWPQADGTIAIHAETRPKDPFRVRDECHVDLDGTLVCVTKGKEPRSVERAEVIAHAWMLGYSVYVRTGKFPRGTIRVKT